MKYVYTQNPDAKVPIMLVDQYIGINANGVEGIMGGQFAREVLALQNAGKTETEVWINSKGGQWSESTTIVGSMENSSIDFTTVNMGFVDSAAGHIFQAGKKRKWMPYAVGLIHEIQGNGSQQVKEALNASVSVILSEKSNRSPEQVRELMKDEKMMDATLAKQYNFCDEVPAGKFNISTFTNSSEAYDYGQKQTKNLLPKNKSMEAVNTVLGLNNEASEAAQLVAINGIIAAKNAAETALAAKETELLTATNALTDTKGKLLLAENEVLKATNENKAAAANALIAEHKGKRLADDATTLQKWTNAAIADYDGTKALIEAINYNATAPDFAAQAAAAAQAKSGIITDAAGYMAS